MYWEVVSTYSYIVSYPANERFGNVVYTLHRKRASKRERLVRGHRSLQVKLLLIGLQTKGSFNVCLFHLVSAPKKTTIFIILIIVYIIVLYTIFNSPVRSGSVRLGARYHVRYFDVCPKSTYTFLYTTNWSKSWNMCNCTIALSCASTLEFAGF